MIKRISIDSDNVCYGPVPNPDDEVFQHLTINSKGRVPKAEVSEETLCEYRRFVEERFRTEPEA